MQNTWAVPTCSPNERTNEIYTALPDLLNSCGEITEVGNGTINFAKIFAARKKAGLKHWFVEQDISKGDIFESLKSSHQFLSSKKYA
ncbi:MAG: hypothetical protein RI983_820 [Bacteroidota bacterium]|jgi:sugar phosphate isomerase/epimerase